MRIAVLGVHRDGGMAGLLAVPAGNLVPAPGLTPDQCAAVEFLAIGAHAVRRGAVSARDRVLVVGAGPIGLGVALFARRAGAAVVVLDRDAERSETARAITGAEAVPAGADPIGSGLPDAAGFDVVFDATGNPRSMETELRLRRPWRPLRAGQRGQGADHLLGPGLPPQGDDARSAAATRPPRISSAVIAAIRDGAIPVDRLVTHRTSLAGAVRDLPRWATEKTGLIKALVELG